MQVVFRGTRPWNLQGKAANADDSLVAYDISGSEGCIDCYVSEVTLANRVQR